MEDKVVRLLLVAIAVALLSSSAVLGADSPRPLMDKWTQAYGVVYSDGNGVVPANPCDYVWWMTSRHKTVWFHVHPNSYGHQPGYTQGSLWSGPKTHGFASGPSATNYKLLIDTSWSWGQYGACSHPGWFYMGYWVSGPYMVEP